MQNQHRKREEESDAESGGAGSARAQGAPEVPLSIEDARAIEDLYKRGGAANFVPARGWTLRDIERRHRDGIIEPQENLRGGAPKVKLTVRGQQLLPRALQIIAASPGQGGR